MSGKRRLLLQGTTFLLVLSLAFYLASFARESVLIQELVARYGYVGIFLIALASGFNVVVPIPAIAFLPLFLESGLHYGPTVLVVVLGMTSADMLVYLLAKKSKSLAQGSLATRFFNKIENWRERWPRLPLFLLLPYAAFVPLPNELMVIPLALMGYRARVLAPVLFFANAVFTLLYAEGVLVVYEFL